MRRGRPGPQPWYLIRPPGRQSRGRGDGRRFTSDRPTTRQGRSTRTGENRRPRILRNRRAGHPVAVTLADQRRPFWPHPSSKNRSESIPKSGPLPAKCTGADNEGCGNQQRDRAGDGRDARPGRVERAYAKDGQQDEPTEDPQKELSRQHQSKEFEDARLPRFPAAPPKVEGPGGGENSDRNCRTKERYDRGHSTATRPGPEANPLPELGDPICL